MCGKKGRLAPSQPSEDPGLRNVVDESTRSLVHTRERDLRVTKFWAELHSRACSGGVSPKLTLVLGHLITYAGMAARLI